MTNDRSTGKFRETEHSKNKTRDLGHSQQFSDPEERLPQADLMNVVKRGALVIQQRRTTHA